MTRAYAEVDFNDRLQPWDGFGINYVETAQTPDYAADPQDYGGFSMLSENSRRVIIDLVFGDEGLWPGVFKMFLDPFHQKPGSLNGPGEGDIDQVNYDHEATTGWMRFFIREGLALTKRRGGGMKGIVTLYGPPAFMTRTRQVRGRDLDPEYKLECAKYMASFAQYLREREGFDISYVSLHNEGEDYHRWPEDGLDANLGTGHDYNLWWTPQMVAEFMPLLGRVLDARGMRDVRPAPGETTNWLRFHQWGYADAVAGDAGAMDALGLITSHGFYGEPVYSGDHRSAGTDLLRAKKPGLHAWTTSTSWSKMDAFFAYELYAQIYSAKVNAVIPWAAVQRSSKWVGGDPNPGCAIRVLDDGSYRIEDGYYFYKQFCRAGQPGMSVAKTSCTFSPACVTAFTGAGRPDAFIAVNAADEPVRFLLSIRGGSPRYDAYRTGGGDKYARIGGLEAPDGCAEYIAPAGSVTTFYAGGR